MKDTITNRVLPCKCGCRGTDPRHRNQYVREIKDIKVNGNFNIRLGIKGFSEPYIILASGIADLPWQKKAVVVRVAFEFSGGTNIPAPGWYIVD